MFDQKSASSKLIPTHATLSLDSLMSSIDEAYASFETMFAEKGIPFLPCPRKKRKGRRHLTNDVMLELAERNVVPFSLRQPKSLYGDTHDCFFSSTRDDRGLPQARAIRSPMSLSIGIDTWESVVSSDWEFISRCKSS
ncbi:hypothetical protein JG687_00001523 [Phytophthora cactorum]|uniref:Uncharacterized protein n=1 Tax=Phytophthora cactorum TaxID=29920 RepID=A0A8T1V0S6_9STRA|nr:hypothetical protein JG687_00001523 [Phytophthora cactorum]